MCTNNIIFPNSGSHQCHTDIFLFLFIGEFSLINPTKFSERHALKEQYETKFNLE
jgi:hypothetical protein